jgi:hypothetical protein
MGFYDDKIAPHVLYLASGTSFRLNKELMLSLVHREIFFTNDSKYNSKITGAAKSSES